MQWLETESFSSQIKNKERMVSLLLLLFNILLEIRARPNRPKKKKRKRNTGLGYRKRRNKTVAVCRSHDLTHRKLWGLKKKKTVGTEMNSLKLQDKN